MSVPVRYYDKAVLTVINRDDGLVTIQMVDPNTGDLEAILPMPADVAIGLGNVLVDKGSYIQSLLFEGAAQEAIDSSD